MQMLKNSKKREQKINDCYGSNPHSGTTERTEFVRAREWIRVLQKTSFSIQYGCHDYVYTTDASVYKKNMDTQTTHRDEGRDSLRRKLAGEGGRQVNWVMLCERDHKIFSLYMKLRKIRNFSTLSSISFTFSEQMNERFERKHFFLNLLLDSPVTNGNDLISWKMTIVTSV